MKSFVVATMAAAVLSGIAVTSASAAPLHHYGLTPSERAAIARSAHDLRVLRARVYADGKVTRFERMRLNWAEARHNALVERYRNN